MYEFDVNLISKFNPHLVKTLMGVIKTLSSEFSPIAALTTVVGVDPFYGSSVAGLETRTPHLRDIITVTSADLYRLCLCIRTHTHKNSANARILCISGAVVIMSIISLK